MKVEFFSGISKHAHIFSNVEIGKNITLFPGAVLGRLPLSRGAARRINISELGPLIISDGCIKGCNAVIYASSRIGRGTMVCGTACVIERVVIAKNLFKRRVI